MKEFQDLYLVTSDIIGAAFEVRKHTGRALREKYYEAALSFELTQRGHEVKRQVTIPAIYKGEIIDDSYKADLIVNDAVIIEVKALSHMKESECRQLITYLKLSDYRIGYLINFGASDFSIGKSTDPLPYTQGIYRYVNNFR